MEVVDLFFLGGVGLTLRLVKKRSSKCSKLSFRPLNAGIVFHNAFWEVRWFVV